MLISKDTIDALEEDDVNAVALQEVDGVYHAEAAQVAPTGKFAVVSV